MTKYTYITENIYNIWNFFTFMFLDHKNDHLHLHNVQWHLYFTFLIFFTLLQSQNKYTPLPNTTIKKKVVLQFKPETFPQWRGINMYIAYNSDVKHCS